MATHSKARILVASRALADHSVYLPALVALEASGLVTRLTDPVVRNWHTIDVYIGRLVTVFTRQENWGLLALKPNHTRCVITPLSNAVVF